jgi:hypothetical protein
MVALHAGLDQTRTVRLGQRVPMMAWMSGERQRMVRQGLSVRLQVPRDRFPHQRTQRFFVHI